ncbi:MAG: polysaccharide deacetylase family protein [Clostridia bacterium]|nr:polysaccharide deacetylase family protein [Clostridia bacterium]
MKRQKNKYAFFTIDVERLADTECVYNTKQPVSQTMMDGLDRYIDILDKHGIKATLFVLSETANEIKEKLKGYIKNGHKIALHGKRHVPPKMMDNEAFEMQIAQAKQDLEDTFGIPVVGYRAPCFSIDREKLAILENLGFRYDASRMEFSARHNSYMNMDGFEKIASEIYKKDNFYEFGISTQKVFGKNFPVSGGGYIRMANWSFIKSLLHKRFKKSDSYVFYTHPFELSREKRPFIKKLKFMDWYYLRAGVNSYPRKIELIIKKLKKQEYTFTTFEDVAK